MGLTAKATGNGADFTPIEAGVHLAVCYGVYDLGTHHDDMYGKDRHQVVILWEVPDSRIEIEKDGAVRNLPRAASNRYTLSLGEKANLRHDLEAWRGRPFTEKELEGFDLRNILGKSCQLGIIHKTRADGKVSAVINSIIGLPRGMQPLALENEMQWFSFEEGVVLPASAPEWIRNEIAKSKEYLAATATASTAPKPGPCHDGEDKPAPSETDEPGADGYYDEIPF